MNDVSNNVIASG